MQLLSIIECQSLRIQCVGLMSEELLVLADMHQEEEEELEFSPHQSWRTSSI